MDLQSGWDWRLQELYHFGDFTLDVSERLLMRRGRRVPLAPKAFDLLVVLVRRSTCLVTKRELLDQVWRGVFVEPGILTVHVSSIRKALDDSKRSPTYIETVSRSGYRFIAAVSSVGGEQRTKQRVDRRPAGEAKTTPLATTSCAHEVRCEEA